MPKYILRKVLQRSFQMLILAGGKIVLRPFTRVDANAVKPNLIHNGQYILVANHRRGIDPFVIMTSMPAKTVFRITPVSFMTKNIFYDSPLWPLLWLSGCFASRNNWGIHKFFGVAGSINLLSNGFSLFIFPEGTRIKKQPRGKAHSGVIRIHDALPDIPMILCHIEYNKGIKAWLTGKRRSVAYKLIEKPNFSDPEQIMDEIFKIPVS